MKKATVAFLLVMVLFFLSGCGGGVTRYGFETDTANYWSTNDVLFVLPIGVMNEFLPSGNDNVDRETAINGVKLDNEILAYIRKYNSKFSIVLLPIKQTEKDIEKALKRHNAQGFYADGNFNDALFASTMKELSEQYRGRILVPRLVERTAFCEYKKYLLSLGLAGRWFADWDGVEDRSASSIIGLFGNIGHDYRGVSVDALSLDAEIYSAKGREYWSYGGFEVLTTLKAFGKVKHRTADEIFSSSHAASDFKAAVNLCLQPFFEKTI